MRYKFLNMSVLAASADQLLLRADGTKTVVEEQQGVVHTNQSLTRLRSSKVFSKTQTLATVQKYNPYGNVPIEMAPQVGGFGDTY